MRDYSEYGFVIDIDGTICPIKPEGTSYADLVPYSQVVERIRYYHKRGARIVLYTSRNMRTFSGNIGAINKVTARVILDWLERWDIPYDEIYYGKPWPGMKGFYVDDRSVRPEEFLALGVEELEAACASSLEAGYPDGARGRLTVVITMAGSGSRFREAGYECPKYMIEAGGRTLFEWSMSSLTDQIEGGAKFVFAVKEGDGAREFVENVCSRLGVTDMEIVELDEPTDGQATTCLLAIEGCGDDEPICVYNIDTYVEPGQLLTSRLEGDGCIPCFEAEGDHWSFVRLDERGKAVEVREKERISGNCSIGAYYFSSASLYRSLYSEYYSDESNVEHGEKYIAPLYNLMIEKGLPVTVCHVDSDKVHVLGTPSELEKFEAECGIEGIEETIVKKPAPVTGTR